MGAQCHNVIHRNKQTFAQGLHRWTDASDTRGAEIKRLSRGVNTSGDKDICENGKQLRDPVLFGTFSTYVVLCYFVVCSLQWLREQEVVVARVVYYFVPFYCNFLFIFFKCVWWHGLDQGLANSEGPQWVWRLDSGESDQEQMERIIWWATSQ